MTRSLFNSLPYLKLTSSVLTAGDMCAWTSSGPALLARLWDNDDMVKFTLQLHGILADLSWGGWKMIALPVLMRKTPKFIEGRGREIIRPLAFISRSGKISLTDVDLEVQARRVVGKGWEALSRRVRI
ncbi:hypothetical protein MPER_04489 [Moniliophthora perniciosa FA553]|nr:hypothetical protein MPER_04489 [Moniliophthora perniciosa FA553]